MNESAHRKEILKSIIEELNRRKRSMEALRLLLEDDDAETALTMSLRMRSDMDAIISRLEAMTGAAPSAPASPAERPPEPATAPAPAVPTVESPAAPAPEIPEAHPARRQAGYLGDEEGAGGFERAVDKIVNGFLDAVSHPRETMARLRISKNGIVIAICLGFAVYTGWKAYNKTFLSEHGLVGEYYLDEELKSLFTKRQDPTINFRWLRRAPMTNYRSEHFSIRWTGFIKADMAGPHEFYTISDDGVRLWINDQKLIDDWGIHGSTIDKGVIELQPGYHRVTIEYFQGAGDSVMKFQWRRPTDKDKKTVAARFLFPKLPEG